MLIVLCGLQVEESGMEVLKKEEKVLSKEEAAEFYKQHEGSEHFDQLVEFMSRYLITIILCVVKVPCFS